MTTRQLLIFLCLLLTLGCASILLFYGGPGTYAIRSVKELWNLGHVLYFALLVLFISRLLGYLNASPKWIWLLSILATLIWGTSIELIQQDSGRSFDLMDIARDFCGALVVLVFLPGLLSGFHQRIQQLARYLVICLLLYILLPLMVAVSDEMIATTQFPVLSNFETPFELDRWEGSAEFEIVNSAQGSSGAMIQVTLGTQEAYSGAGLRYLVSDWSDYHFLNLDIYYPHKTSLRLSLKVFDSRHQTVQPTFLSSDRFNRSYRLKNGWNRILVPLREIRKSPESREMDLTQIARVQLFSRRLEQSLTIYLDRIYLSN